MRAKGKFKGEKNTRKLILPIRKRLLYVLGYIFLILSPHAREKATKSQEVTECEGIRKREKHY